MDVAGTGSGVACCVGAGLVSWAMEAEGVVGVGGGTGRGAGTDTGAETTGAGGVMAIGSGIKDAGCGACVLGTRPVAVGWTGILGTDCVEVGGMGGLGIEVGVRPAVAADTGGREVVMVAKPDAGAMPCVGLVAIVGEAGGGTGRSCAVLTGLTLPVPVETGVAGGGLSPCSSSFFSSRMSKSRLTASIL